jgi:hypothetical protein
MVQHDKFPPPTNPMGVARQLLAEQERAGYTTLRYGRGGWMRWAGYRWAEDEPDAVRALACTELEHATCDGSEGLQEWEPNHRKISDVADAMKAITLLPEVTDSPSWLRPEVGVPFPPRRR